MDASELLTSPPHAFDGFEVALDPPEKQEGVPWARYRFACRDCASRSFTLEEVLSGPYGAAGVEATCCRCGRTASVFHASRDGYDGRLDLLPFLQETSGRRRLRDYDEQPVEAGLVACEVSYSIDPDELASLAAEKDVAPNDLFDGFAILTSNPGHVAWRYVWDYECA